MNSETSGMSKVGSKRAPYRAPELTLVLHHSQTRNKGGTGFDGDTNTNNNKS